jgi:hypothetical protein
MTLFECPKCGQFVSDRALDAGECPFCGYDGAMIGAASPRRAWLIATVVVVLGGGALGAYLLVPRAEIIHLRGPESAAAKPAPAPPAQPIPATPELAPFPRSIVPHPPPARPIATAPPKEQPRNQPPANFGPVERIDPRAVRDRRIDAPAGAVSVSDLSGDDRLWLRGVVGQLRIGSVSGGAKLDASDLVAREIIITGDLSGRAIVRLHAPDGTVSIGGHIEGTARVVVNAPRGEVVLSAGSGKLDEDVELTVIARSIEVGGAMRGNAKLIVTLTGGGTVTLGSMHDNASVVYVPQP